MTVWERDRRRYRTGSTIRRGVPNPLICGRKLCAKCGRWRHGCYFRPLAANTGSGLDSYCETCRRADRRARWARASAEQRKLVIEYERIRAEVKRRERGVTPRKFRNRRTVVDRAEMKFLPVGPLRAAMKREGYEPALLARRAGVDSRSVHRVRYENRWVRFDLADKLALALGTTLWALYEDTPLVSGRNGIARAA